MKMIDKIKSMGIDEFVNCLDKYVALDNAPWLSWFEKTYCDKCETEIVYNEKFKNEDMYGWCELNGKCRFFQDMDETPDNKQTIKMWLESEAE